MIQKVPSGLTLAAPVTFVATICALGLAIEAVPNQTTCVAEPPVPRMAAARVGKLLPVPPPPGATVAVQPAAPVRSTRLASAALVRAV